MRRASSSASGRRGKGQRVSLTAELKERCRVIRDTISARSLATDDEVATYWPGGDDNPGRDLRAWVYAFANLVRFSGRMVVAPEVHLAARAAADQSVIDALRAQPAIITLTNRGYTQREDTRVTVHPKSFDALQWFAARDARIAWLNEQRAAILARALPESPGLAERIGTEIAYQYGLMVMAATASGPYLPWEIGEEPELLDEPTDALSPVEMLQVLNAFVEVNALRLHALQRLMSPEEGNERPSWATFFASQASEPGNPSARALMRDRSLAEVIATALVASDARKRAADRAKQKANPRSRGAAVLATRD